MATGAEPMATDAAPPTAAATATPAAVVEVTPEERAWLDLAANVTLLEKGVAAVEARFLVRVLRTLTAQRRKLTKALLSRAVTEYFGHDLAHRDELLALLGEMVVTDAPAKVVSGKGPTTASVETQLYLHLLIVLYLIDQRQFVEALGLVSRAIQVAHAANKRSLDKLTARLFYYSARLHEQVNSYETVRLPLLNALRTATLRHDEECQITLLNELLRNYLHYNLFEQAEKLAAKTTLPETVGNNQHARYFYYLGRIKAIQLDYSEAFRHLQQAVRKAPQAPSAPGFQQAVHKLMVIVQLLLGEIPERSLFRQAVLRKPLQPYLRLTQSVRVGDVRQFQEVMVAHGAQFVADKTFTLIMRLRHNVIKTGVRMISLSYSRISLADLAVKLHLDSVEDAEYIVAKAIRDGVIEASIDHARGFMQSKETVDVYATKEPQLAFHQRIEFCLNLHNESVKALRFPAQLQRKPFESIEDRREREKQEKEALEEQEEDEDY